MFEFKKEELVVLIPELDDENVNRVYKVLNVRNNQVDVEVFSEKFINKSNNSWSTIGKVFKDIMSSSFKPYM